ncbi:CD109 antigen-like [Ostrea edulis]|uniref:CD109 antigen-like n=1 Tax=Ostrea edulis TaxID=37623 RepID=UPI0024AF0815|nr:CD109 antigen-like [Ostrea edulis]
MMKLWMISLFALTVMGAKTGNYLVITPEEAVRGEVYPVTVTNYREEAADVTVQIASMSGPYAKKMVAGLIPAQKFLKLDIEVSDEFTGEFNLTVNLTYQQSKMNILNSTTVPIKEASGFLNIQTDKKMYKKNQKVLIRTLAIDRDLMPMNENVTIFIKDPQGNRVEMWKNLQPKSGVTQAEFLLSDDPAMGDWSIYAEQRHSDKETITYMVKFTVDKFVLPRFEVSVVGPTSLYARTQKPFNVQVTARYTYGENVVGNARLHITNGNIEMNKPYQDLTEGTTIFTLQPQEMKTTGYNTVLKVKAIVTEGSSKIELEEETTIPLTYHMFKVERIGDDYFIRGDPYHYCVLVTNDRGQLIPAEERQNFQLQIVRDQNAKALQYVKLSSMMVTNGKHVYCGTVNPPFESSISLQLTVKGLDSTQLSTTIYANIYEVTTSENNTAGSLGLMLWNEQQNQLALSDKFNVGEVAKFRVFKSTQASTNLIVFYQVFSRGLSLANGMVDFGQGNTSTLSVTTTRAMSPMAAVVVYAVSNGYVITSMQKIKINLNLNSQVTMTYGASRALVGSDITLAVTTPEPYSFVALVAIDKGSELLGSPNDITETEVLKGLELYTMGTDNQPSGPRIMQKRSFMPWNMIEYSTERILNMVGVQWMTDAIVHREQHPILLDDGVFKNQAANFPEVLEAMPDIQQKSPDSESAGDTKVRKNFPETWIWLDGESGSDSRFGVQKTLPDSITSWVTRAIVVSPSTGLHIPDVTQIESFKSFFLVIDTPPSIIQGEVFEVKLLVFNYIETGPEKLQANVSLMGKVRNTAKIWSTELDEEPASSEMVSKTISVKRGQSSMFAVWVRKLDTDDFSPVLTLRGDATAKDGQQTYIDRIEKDVSAEPEGRQIQKTKVISLEATGSTELAPVPISFPEKAVKGSKAVYVLAMGDLLGQALNNPEKMITVPTGCGEQNMATTVPNIYVLQYLRAIQASEPKLEAKIIQHIKTGYQRELNYKRNDGSFSAFGMSDPAGSTWLTAFVLKSFTEIHSMLPDLVDPQVMRGAMAWLNKQVSDRGSVQEPGRVIHTEMQGSMSDSKEKLAAFVLSCYAEVMSVFGMDDDSVYIAAKKKTLAVKTLLKSNLPSAVSNPYYTALLTYALAVDGSSATEVFQLITKLTGSATTYMDGAKEMKCLGQNCSDSEEDKEGADLRGYSTRDTSPSSIEMTGYLLMTVIKFQQSYLAPPFLRWLNSKRNSLGGWYSTQDTVIGLKAMSELAKKKGNGNKNLRIDVEITAKQTDTVLKTETIQITPETRILLQRAEFPVDTTSLEIKPSQTGEAIVTVVWQYNLVDALYNNELQVSVGKYTISNDFYDINPCVRYMGDTPSNMALVTVTMGSGIVPDVHKLERDPKLSKVEVQGSQVHIYLNEVTKESQCMRFRAFQTTEVLDPKDVPVKAVLYYKPEVSAVVSYSPSTSNRVNFCDGDICAGTGHVKSSLAVVIMVSVVAAFTTGPFF